MIHPLRRRHRRMLSALFMLLVVAATVALVWPAPSARVEQLPALPSVADGYR
jgi:hypothetical protein